MGHAPEYFTTFTRTCVICGATIGVLDGVEQPHVCRIDLDAQKGLTVLTPRDREVIAAAYEVDADRLDRIHTRNPILFIHSRAMASFLRSRAAIIRKGPAE